MYDCDKTYNINYIHIFKMFCNDMIPNNIPIYEKKLSDKPSPIQDERPPL